MSMAKISTEGLQYTRNALREFLRQNPNDDADDVPVSAIFMASATFRIPAGVARRAAHVRLSEIETELKERKEI
jgi:hypothetical protein